LRRYGRSSRAAWRRQEVEDGSSHSGLLVVGWRDIVDRRGLRHHYAGSWVSSRARRLWLARHHPIMRRAFSFWPRSIEMFSPAVIGGETRIIERRSPIGNHSDWHDIVASALPEGTFSAATRVGAIYKSKGKEIDEVIDFEGTRRFNDLDHR
jgi:hypothetical protein